METIGFKMQLLPDQAEEYQKRHDDIWPELVNALKDAGISNYSIFLDPETDTLFGVLDREDAQRMAALAEEPIVRRWWDVMSPLMQTHDDNEPVSVALTRVFHLP